MENFLTQICSLISTMLLLLLIIHLTAAAIDTTVIAIDTNVAADDECPTSFEKDLGSLLDVTVADPQKLNTRQFKIVMKEGKNFSSIFTGNCTFDNFPGISVEYRIKGSKDWSQVAFEGIEETGNKNLTEIKEGKVRVAIGEELNYCQKYEIKLKVNNNDNTISDTIVFGPLKERFTPDQLNKLDEDIGAIDRIDMNFHELKEEFNATWSNICAGSLRIWLKNGEDPKYTLFKKGTKVNLTDSNSSHSVIIPTKPCIEYHLELETFLTPNPETKQKQYQHGTYYGGNHHFMSSPEEETFGHIEMEENSTKLSWDLREYFKHENNKSVPICVVGGTLSYNITFGLIGEEKQILKESKNPNVNTTEEFDIGKASKDKKLKDLEKFCPYEVKMEISYETKTNKTKVRTFSKYLITNREGDISAAAKPILKADESILKASDISQKSTCLKKMYAFDCWLAKNQSSSENRIVPTDALNVLELNFKADSELKCRVKIEYKTAKGNETIAETGWSDALKLTVGPDPTSSSVGTIVGVVILVLVLAGGVGAVVYYRRKHSSVNVSHGTSNLSYGSQ